jgi:hypothetical protein
MFNGNFKSLIIAFLLGNGSSIGVEHLVLNNDNSQNTPLVSQVNSDTIINEVHAAINKFMPILNSAYSKGRECGARIDIDSLVRDTVKDNPNQDVMVSVQNSIDKIIHELKKCQ